jgi:DNA-binding LytR/AlgR family response regulator
VTYSVVLIEDEPPARAKLARFIAELEDFRVVAEAATVDEGIAAVTAAVPDVIYLDIQLGTRSGFDVIDGLHGIGAPLVVFTTAYSEYAVRAFEVQAVDYLLKPFDLDRFMGASSAFGPRWRSPITAIWKSACAVCWRGSRGGRRHRVRSSCARQTALSSYRSTTFSAYLRRETMLRCTHLAKSIWCANR